MDELLDILDENGNLTGTTAFKSEAHRLGLFHATIHVWLYTIDEKVLLQKRASTKKVFPNLWDISVAGHIGAGEEIFDAAIREVYEEIGLKLTQDQLIKIGIRKHMVKHDNGILDHEFHHVFIAELKENLQSLTIQEEEVADLQLFDLSILRQTKNLENILLPRFHDYYCQVYDSIYSLGF